ncbi:unnamed protein product, partial [Rotaria magnacalcarata]
MSLNQVYLLIRIKTKHIGLFVDVIFQVELPKSDTIEGLSPFDEDTQTASYPTIPPLSPIRTQENVDLSSLMNTSTDVEVKSKEEPRKEFAMDAG